MVKNQFIRCFAYIPKSTKLLQGILKENVQISLHDHNLNSTWLMHQDNNPKLTSTTSFKTRNKVLVAINPWNPPKCIKTFLQRLCKSLYKYCKVCEKV